ncbi:hypothetical protein B0I35DRAFT_427638 [Stachybotrys elegans]|uniref:Uncharacterized protein n=1 Tax=Stachybotrys elegans TaxID=80388 RepID=A0A8K0STM6_9HYPO|nr:hypothetical protein B0I35DRAFT_427638 [Stachybotrys elegans]
MADQVQKDGKKLDTAPSQRMSIKDGYSEPSNLHTGALKLAATHVADDIDPHVDKKLPRKIDWSLMLLVRS